MSDTAPFGLFRGPQRCLATSLSVDECVRRLQTEIGKPTLLGRKWRGWYPLRSAPNISRKMRKRQVLFLTDTPDRGGEWFFYSKFIPHGSGTMISGQYRTPTTVWVLSLVVVLYGVYLVVSSYLGVPALILARRSGGMRVIPVTEAVLLAVGIPLFILIFLGIHGVLYRKKHRTEEQEILSAVKQLFAAEDAPHPRGHQ